MKSYEEEIRDAETRPFTADEIARLPLAFQGFGTPDIVLRRANVLARQADRAVVGNFNGVPYSVPKGGFDAGTLKDAIAGVHAMLAARR